MAVINAFSRFRLRRRKSLPIVKVPRNVREAFNVDVMYKNGIAKLETGKKNCLYDRCYVFEEINYINKDEGEKESFLNQFMGWLKTYPDKISSCMMIGSSYAGVTYNTNGDATSGIKNVQFYGLMPMTNKATEAEYTCNGTKVSYRIAGPVRCVRDAE